MSSLLDAVNTTPNKIEVTDQLPTRVGDVSIMTISQAFVALANSNSKHNTFCHHNDPNPGWGTSTYYVYGIVGSDGINSTIENLQAVGLDWYKQLKTPGTRPHTFTSNGKTIFGGPLGSVSQDINLNYILYWYYQIDKRDFEFDSVYWGGSVNPSVYIAVVRAHE